MKKSMPKGWGLVVAAVVVASGTAVQAQQADGPWMVRVRAVNLDSVNKDSTGLDLWVNDKVIPDVDISYFFTPNIAAELLLTVPQKHTLYSGGQRIGSLKHLPPTLTLQYHFTGLGALKPYVGAGVNYTRFSKVRFVDAVEDALDPSIDKSSVGAAFQVGVDIALTRNVYLNFDVKKIRIRADVESAGDSVGTLKIDPLVAGAGIGFRF